MALPKYQVHNMIPSKVPRLTFRESNHGFVAVKVCTQDAHQATRVHRELQFYEHINSLSSKHHGQAFIRGLLGTFQVTGPTGQHLCLVHPPMHVTIRELQYMNSSQRLNELLLRWTLDNVLSALSFLHEEAGVVHTGKSSRQRVRISY